MYDVEIQGLKFGKIICRRKKKVYDVNILVNSQQFSDRIILNKDMIEIEYFTAVGCDRVKLLVDGLEWLNKSLITIDLSSFKIGEMYEMSDDFKTWKIKKLDAINEESEHPFITYGEDMLTRSVSFAWRYCREVIK